MTFDWDQRVDRNGQLAPLAPEDGFRLEASASFAEPCLLGQDTFVKLSAAALEVLRRSADNLVLRGDLRYDQGIPLGGAVLLPEVERFFAGGDIDRARLRGRPARDRDRPGRRAAARRTSSQIRVIPAGGNIRALGSLDAQLRIYKILAGARCSATPA